MMPAEAERAFLVAKLADPAVQKIIDWVLADFLGWCCFTSACAGFRERGDVNGRFVQALADTVCFDLSGREPSMPRDEDFRKLNTWRFAGFGKYTRFPYLFPAMQNSAVWLLSEETCGFSTPTSPFKSRCAPGHTTSRARRRFFAEVDRFADLMPPGK